ncbi:MAG TPA: hypothetical protein V6C96_01875 [Vampirovibrionales bacterium]
MYDNKKGDLLISLQELTLEADYETYILEDLEFVPEQEALYAKVTGIKEYLDWKDYSLGTVEQHVEHYLHEIAEIKFCLSELLKKYGNFAEKEKFKTLVQNENKDEEGVER